MSSNIFGPTSSSSVPCLSPKALDILFTNSRCLAVFQELPIKFARSNNASAGFANLYPLCISNASLGIVRASGASVTQ